MKKLEMLEIKASRQNLVGFLYFADEARLNLLFDNNFNVSKKSFNEICDAALECYSDKRLKNEITSEIFVILRCSNKSFKTESHRLDNCGSIYEYDESAKSYVFLKKGGQREFNLLNHYLEV